MTPSKIFVKFMRFLGYEYYWTVAFIDWSGTAYPSATSWEQAMSEAKRSSGKSIYFVQKSWWKVRRMGADR